MKLWRKLAKKEFSGEFNSFTNIHTGEVIGKEPVMKRNGREIRYNLIMGEQMAKFSKRSYPLLDALIQNAGIKFVMNKKEEAKLQEILKESTDETK